MLRNTVLDRFMARTPMAVAIRGTLEYAFAPEPLDAMFENLAGAREDRRLLFSTCVDVMGTVVTRVNRSINAAYRTIADVPASIAALYQRFQRMPLEAGRALVRHTADRLEPVIGAMSGAGAAPLPGYRTKVLDGNHLARTQRRLQVLRDVAAGPLPGQTLVVLDPALGLALDVIPCADGHAQERSLLDAVIDPVRDKDLWVADRNVCTTGFVLGIAARGGCFVIRRHATTLSWDQESAWESRGRTETGVLEEPTITLLGPGGVTLKVRHIRLTLDRPTRDGAAVIDVLTNLPAQAATAGVVAERYRGRWTVEALFYRLTMILGCEVDTLGYPPAALFGFCVALASSNAYAMVRAAVRGEHGNEAAENLSDFSVAAELERTVEGMGVAVPEEAWDPITAWSPDQMGAWLRSIMRMARLDRDQKAKRGPKKPKTRRTRFAAKKHVATSRLISGEQK